MIHSCKKNHFDQRILKNPLRVVSLRHIFINLLLMAYLGDGEDEIFGAKPVRI